MEKHFESVVDLIFNNWTALQLSIENSSNSDVKEILIQIKNYVCNMCFNQSNISATDLEDALTDILDQEFDTICEDNSPKEVSLLLVKFLNLLKENKLEEFQLEFSKLPNNRQARQIRQNTTEQVEEPCGSNMETEEPSEWITITGKRRK